MMKEHFKADSSSILVNAQTKNLLAEGRLWQKCTVELGAMMVVTTIVWGALIAGTTTASAQSLTPDRPTLPAMSLTEDGAFSMWRNPANLGFDPDPSIGFLYGSTLDSADTPSTAPKTFAFASNAGPLGLGLTYHSKFEHPEWWTLSSSIAFGSDSFQVGGHLGWHLPAGVENNFVTYDLGSGWRPNHWLGFSAVGYNLGANVRHVDIEEQVAAGMTFRPARHILEVGANYLWHTNPDTNIPDHIEGFVRSEPIEGLTVRLGVNQLGTIQAGLEFGLGGSSIGAHSRTGPNTGSSPYMMGSLQGNPDIGKLFKGGSRVPEIALRDAYPYQPVRSIFLQQGESYLHLLGRIHDAATARDTKAMIVKVDWSPFSFAQTEEILALFDVARTNGKKVVVYLGEDTGNSAYMLASGADLVLMNPAQQLMLVGLSAELMFFRETLDMVGVNPQFARRAEYKSAMEGFTQQEASVAQREQMNALMDDMSGRLIARIATGRDKATEEVVDLIDGGPYTADDALSKGLIDATSLPDEIHRKVRKMLKSRVFFDEEYKTVDNRTGWKAAREIAVVYVDGVITTGPSSGPGLFGGNQTAGSETITKQLREAEDAQNVKAVILRVDSPGGSALASDEIWHAVKRLRKAGKPVVVSMGGVAASGGYYVSAGANAIYAQNSTITGSIGVVGGKFSLSHMYDKLGINYELYNRGRNAAMWSMSKPFDDAEFAAFDRLLGDIYTQFTSKVALGRDMDIEDVEDLAKGRVWSGQRALDNKLVDEVGGFFDAVKRAKLEARIPENAHVELVTYSSLPGIGDRLMTEGVTLFRSAILGNKQIKHKVPELELLHQWQAISNERVWTLMPYRVDVR